VRAAAEEAQRAATQQLGTLQSMDGTLEDLFQLGQRQLGTLQTIAASLAGGGGGGAYGFELSRTVER
jgi:hypothetical protein